MSFEVRGRRRAFAYKSGQFLTVAVPSDRTGLVARCYSLSSAPHESDLLKITVKRTVDGYASNWICDNVRTGHTLRVLPPERHLHAEVDFDDDLLLFAGGSGITPVISIAKTALAKGGGKVVLLYANRDEDSVIFAGELDRAGRRSIRDRFVVVHWLESVQGLPTPEHMQAFAEHFTSYNAFVCGPGPFMKGVVEALKELGFPRERRHQEKFVSLGGNPFGDADGSSSTTRATSPRRSTRPATHRAGERARSTSTARTFTFGDWPGDKKLLDFLLEKGLDAPYSCREGNCSACAIRLLEGEVTMLHNEVLEDEDLDEGIRLACQSLPVTDKVKISLRRGSPCGACPGNVRRKWSPWQRSSDDVPNKVDELDAMAAARYRRVIVGHSSGVTAPSGRYSRREDLPAPLRATREAGARRRGWSRRRGRGRTRSRRAAGRRPWSPRRRSATRRPPRRRSVADAAGEEASRR